MDLNENLGLGTLLQHFGEAEKIKGAVVAPIFQNSLFLFDEVEALTDAIANHPAGPPYHYSRLGNPTVEIAEKKIAMLEGTEACKVTGCGMGAITDAVMSCVKSGSHVIALDTCYGPVKHLLSVYLAKFGVEVTYVDGLCTDQLLEAIRPETTLIYLESPSSILFRLQDVPAITKVARERGITTVIDNTYNTPLHFQPHLAGVDLVCHSATKYFGGHSDVTAGAICGTAERMEKITRNELNFLGNILHPFQSWLLTRGLRTLALRLKHHETSANTVAAWLEDHPAVARVHHISLPSYPQRELYQRMLKGSGGLFSFEPKEQDEMKLRKLCNGLKIFGRGISWGGFESLAVLLKTAPLNYPNQKLVIRLFCGLEDAPDLIADLDQAFGLMG